MTTTEQELARLMAMPANWDGYGSRPIQPLAHVNMVRVLHALDGVVPPPQLCPISGGALQAEWSVEGRELEIVTRSSGSITCLTMEGDDTDTIQVEDVDPTDSRSLIDKARWLCPHLAAPSSASPAPAT